MVEKSSATHSVRLFGRVAPDETKIYKLIAGMDGVVREISPVTTGSRVAKIEVQLADLVKLQQVAPRVEQEVQALNALADHVAAKTRILEKLNLTSTADLVRYALENKLLS